MGKPKEKWTSEEEEALKAGIAKHGTGKWKDIQRDPDFHPFLSSRSNIDLKDKWRNMSSSARIQGSRDKSKTSKAKAKTDAQPPTATQLSTTQPAGSTPASILHDATAIPAVDDSSKGLSDGKTAPVYNALIFEALSTSMEPNGLETSQIVSFIEQQRLKFPPNFRKQLSSRLRRLVAQDKIEKVQNYYKMKSNTSSETKTLVVKKDTQLKQLQNVCQNNVVDPIEAALAAASRIAEAENKAFELAETVKEQERISKMIEENETMLHFAKELFERCSTGDTIQIR